MHPSDHVNPDRILSTFLELVQIDSPSGQEAEIGKHLAARLRSLGCSVEQDEHGNLIARKPGQGDQIVLLSAHMDTVGKDTGIKPAVRDGVVYSDGTTILGADDKSGVAVVLEALELLSEQEGWGHPSLEIVISVSEEIGLVGAKKLDAGQLQADWGLIFDGGGPIGTMVYTAPSQNSFEITVIGKTAHAGGEPENGINAIRIAAEAISAMPLGRIDAETTSNVGIIQGGAARNIVPDRVTIRAEARSRDAAKLEKQTATMVEALEQAAARHGGSVKIDIESSYRTYAISPDQPPYRSAKQAIETLGFPFLPKPSGGGTDGNIYNEAGIPCIVLSTGMSDVHTSAEHIAVQDLIDSARVLITLLTQDF